MESVLYVCDLLSGMTRKGNIQISIQHKRFVIKREFDIRIYSYNNKTISHLASN